MSDEFLRDLTTDLQLVTASVLDVPAHERDGMTQRLREPILRAMRRIDQGWKEQRIRAELAEAQAVAKNLR